MPVTIRSLHIYPIKGCAAVDVDRIAFDGDGLIEGDRRAMIVDEATGAFVSQRHEPTLATLVATLDGIGHLTLQFPGATPATLTTTMNGPKRRVTVWDDTFDAIDCGDAVATSLSDWLGRAVRLVRLPARPTRVVDAYWTADEIVTSFADLAPILVTSSASLMDLNRRRAEAGQSPIEMARFRPNVVIDGLDAWREDGVGQLDGDRYSIQFIKPCARCKVIELDPRSGDATGDQVLASLAAFRAMQNRRGTRGVMFGQNAIARMSSMYPAVMQVGDMLGVDTGT